ncbi:MAG: histidine--tRNA ligase [Bacteroidales bacterium]|nr:histidine--tRNA ligase [Bacteroidales bacterium]MCF8403315.1 histidine--tRNA ligase [Bacteroidales bacterium]
MAQKPSIPKGTRDFSPTEMVRRNYIFDTIKTVFKLYGYQPIETPSMENLSTLMGKYGIEGDKLLFKILNSGDYLSKIPGEKIQNPKIGEFTFLIADKGLRYDLTVPFARYVVQHRNEITFPFKRYQIQPVWRADRPQKGRYREFFQCDVDVIGSNSLLNEVELVQIMNAVFSKLNVSNTIKINNRKVLFGIAEYIGETEKFQSITVAIDKLDKIGIEKVKEELLDSGIRADAIEKLAKVLNFEGNNENKIYFLKGLLKGSETGNKGMLEVEEVFTTLKNFDLQSQIQFDLTLARGLNYYTGAIFEVSANNVKIGSICGGGRYDDLTGIFGLPDVSGVGVSFGADRIYDVMLELDLFPKDAEETTKVLFVNFGEKEQNYCLPLVDKLRKSGINAELFPEPAKMKKQMTYANNKNIPFVVLIGENEMEQGILTVKNMIAGDQTQFNSIETLISQI